jgi:hypothetical protein
MRHVRWLPVAAGRGKNNAKCNKCYACAHKRLNHACRLCMCEKINSCFRLTQGILQELWYNEHETTYDSTGLKPTPAGERRGVQRRRYSDLHELLQNPYNQLPSGRGGTRRADTTPMRPGVPEEERSWGPEADLREAVIDGLDRLADRLDPNVGLTAVAASLDALVQHAERERGDVERAGAGRDAGVQADSESARGELASAMARITALEEQVRARDAALSAVADVAARLTAVEAQLAAAEGDGEAAEGDWDGEGDGEEDEESEREPDPPKRPRGKQGRSKEDRKRCK